MGLLKHTWKHIRRSPYQALAAVMVMAFTLSIASLSLLSAMGFQKVLDFVESQPQITVFFKDEATTTQVDQLKEKLNATGKVAFLKYVSKEDALKIYREQNKDDPLLLELVTANILPASLEVSAIDAKYLADFAEILKDNPVIEDIAYQKDLVNRVVILTNTARTSGMIWVVFSTVISLFIILLVIGIRISSRKEEIEIMKLVGASSWYIGRPFILEGAFYGLAGAILAGGFSYLFIFQLSTSLAMALPFFESLNFLAVRQPLFILEVLGGLMISGFSLGSLGSSLAVWRYL